MALCSDGNAHLKSRPCAPQAAKLHLWLAQEVFFSSGQAAEGILAAVEEGTACFRVV
jgi:hypothetical protein